MLNSYITATIQETQVIAEGIVPQILSSKIALFYGDLGSGKTLMCSSIIRRLCHDPYLIVASPTFNIVKTYQKDDLIIHHYDLYRLKTTAEFEEIGLLDSLNERSSICLIEWPQIAEQIMPTDALKIAIEHFGEGRKISVSF